MEKDLIKFIITGIKCSDNSIDDTYFEFESYKLDGIYEEDYYNFLSDFMNEKFECYIDDFSFSFSERNYTFEEMVELIENTNLSLEEIEELIKIVELRILENSKQ